MMRFRSLLIGLLLACATAASAQMTTMGVGTGGFGGNAVVPTYMATPILSLVGGTTAPSNSVVDYAYIVNTSGVNNFTSSSTTRTWIIATAGTISNLVVTFPTTVTQGSYALVLMDNGSPTSLTCTIGIGTGPQTCTDISDAPTVTAGDLLQWRVTPTGTPTAQTAQVQLSALFTSTVGQESPLFGGGPGNMSTVAATPNYSGLNNAIGWFTTDAVASSVVPVPGVIDKLMVEQSGSSGSGASYTYTVYKNGVATSLGAANCVISGTSATTCSDLNAGDAITVAAGDTISIQSLASASAPTARSATTGLRWVPTTANQALLFVNPYSVPTTTATRYLVLNGGSIAGGSAAAEGTVAPIGMTLKNLYVAQCPGPGAGVTRTYTLQAGGVNQNPTVTMAAGTTACPTLSVASDTHSYSPSAATLLNYVTTVSGTNTALTEMKIGMVATVP